MFVPPPGTSTARLILSPPVMALAERLVKPAPPPVKLVAVMLPAEKFPLASRATIVPGALVLVAALAALAPLPLGVFALTAVFRCNHG